MKSPIRIALTVLVSCVLVPTSFVHAEGSDTTTPETSTPTTVPEIVSTTVPEPSPTTTTTTLPRVSRPQRGVASIGFARIVLDEQRVYVYNHRKRLIASLPVSTGVDDQTPVGTFKVFSQSAQAFYTPDPSERMRWMTRFTKGRQGGNIGFHGIPYKVTKTGEIPFFTPLGVAPSSHGCIRMRVADAKWLFHNMDIGTVVSVVRSRG
ncbi:MAG: murein L,D-transpeptidase [Ilumatobacteraceae bacterium]|nr:murein L,D-transpeptidase [Ilumatobacteraceae bacterium]